MSKYTPIVEDTDTFLDCLDIIEDDFSDIIEIYTKFKLIDHLSEENDE